jgi:hypothetical protein
MIFNESGRGILWDIVAALAIGLIATIVVPMLLS